MLLEFKRMPPEELIALEFPSLEVFRQATRIAVENEISVDAPGYNFLIVRKVDKLLFASITCGEEEIINPERVPSEQFSKLQRFFTQ